MVRGGVILVTAVFTVYFLKRKLYLHNYIGCGFVIVGIALVGMANYIFPKSSNSSDVQNIKKNLLVFYSYLNVSFLAFILIHINLLLILIDFLDGDNFYLLDLDFADYKWSALRF